VTTTTEQPTTPERKARSQMLDRVPAAIALGAALLYTLGVIKTLGQLRASDVNEAHGLGLIPLDRHLRNGVSIIADPVVLLLIAL
jgi:hypothetical protein